MKRETKVLMTFDNGVDRIIVRQLEEAIIWFEVEHESKADQNDTFFKPFYNQNKAMAEARELVEAAVYFEQEAK